jgi:signal transduction histidine kinase
MSADPGSALDVVVELYEQEAALLANEIHDRPVQVLTAASLRLQTAAYFGELTPELAEEVAASIAEAASDLRGMMSSLVAWWNARGNLGEALRAQAVQRCAAAGIQPQLELDCPQPLPARYSAAALRLGEEAVENALAHSGTEELEVHLSCDEDQLLLEVRDTGSGFDASAAASSPGLERMRRRAVAVGGEVVIETAPGAGTTVRVLIPVTP